MSLSITPTFIVSIVAVTLSALGLLLSRIVTRRVRVRVHRAIFVHEKVVGPECYFINVTNLSMSREVEVTHVWFECAPRIDVFPVERPLPKRLKVDETWETWVRANTLPPALTDTEVYKLARVRLSTGKVFRSKQHERPPNFGRVPGGVPPEAPKGTVQAVRTTSQGPLQKREQISADRAIKLLSTQIGEPIEDLPHDDPGVYDWETITLRILEEAFGPHHRNVNHFVCRVTYPGSDEELQQRHVEWVRERKAMLRMFVKELQMFHQPELTAHDSTSTQQVESQKSTNPKAFVSHSTQDRSFVERFAADLRTRGIDAWYSAWEIKPGDSIRRRSKRVWGNASISSLSYPRTASADRGFKPSLTLRL
jgi:hypothetical protein